MKIQRTGFVLLGILLCAAVPGLAQKAPEGQDQAAEGAAEVRLLYAIEPEVIAREYHNRTEYEYRLNDNLYMIRTVPEKGSAYYLVDTLGTGELEYRRDAAQLDIQAPAWVLHRW